MRNSTIIGLNVYKTSFMTPELAWRVPYIATLRDVVIETRLGAIFDDRNLKVYIRETSDQNFSKHPYVCAPPSADGRFFPVFLPPSSTFYKEPFIFLGVDGTNYSHWITRNLLKLYLLENKNIRESMPILINEDLCHFQTEYLDLLGIPKERLLLPPKYSTLQCSTVLVPTTLRGHPQMHVAVDWLRSRLAHNFSNRNGGQLIYLSRRDSPHRVMLNEEELEQRLTAIGFNCITGSDLSVKEQIRIFSDARMIIGPHGAGLTNLIWAHKNTTVLEITNTKIYHMNDFRLISEIRGHTYSQIISSTYPETQPADAIDEQQRHNYFVDVELVMKKVNALLK
jgi:capsular polysaccharide biosynthesis protein